MEENIKTLSIPYGYEFDRVENGKVILKKVCNGISSRYWRNDISDYMRDEVVRKIRGMFVTARMKLK